MEKLSATVFNISHNTARRPLITLDENKKCLIDTGAYMTVINKSYADEFDGHSVESYAPLSGFGGEGVITPIHYWRELTLRQGNSILCFRNTLTFVSDFNKFDIILSPFYLYNHDIAISRLHRFIVNGGNVIDCGYQRGTLRKHYGTSEEVMSILAQL